jgi:hypothetical protein
MNYKLEKQSPTRHRDTTFSEFVNVESGHLRFGDVEVFVVKLDGDQKWWIIPCSYDDDEFMDDNGPYDEVGDALLMLRLLGENKH